MDAFIENYFSFYYVSLTLFTLMGLVLILKLLRSKKGGKQKQFYITFRKLNHRFEKELHKLKALSPEKKKRFSKWFRKSSKSATSAAEEEQAKTSPSEANSEENPQEKASTQGRPKVYVIHFVGDIMARAVEHLREEVSLLIQVATPEDEVVVRLTSPGGAVPQYGLASAQLDRLRRAGLSLTACVDTVAASGGYMMAVVANKIVASPFAFLGSIGVVAGFPNFHKVLKKNEVDYLLFTAGKYKRTVTPLSEVTEEGKQKMQENLQDIHDAFKQHIQEYRSHLNMDEVGTGEYWLATQAKEKGLVDDIMTSDDYLMTKFDRYDVIELKVVEPRNKLERMLQSGVLLIQSWLGQREALSQFPLSIEEQLQHYQVRGEVL